MASALSFVTDALAVYRLTRLVTEDELLADLREWIWKHHPPEDTKLGYFVTCPFCVSIWAGGAVALMSVASTGDNRLDRMFSGTVGVLKYTLALSGAVSLSREALDRLD